MIKEKWLGECSGGLIGIGYGKGYLGIWFRMKGGMVIKKGRKKEIKYNKEEGVIEIEI